MRKANKLLVLALCAGLSVTAFGGCSKGSDKKDSKENTKQEETKKEDDSSLVTDENPLIDDAASYITTLADYKKVELKKSEVDEELQNQIDATLDAYAIYKQIKKGKVKEGDTVNIYYVGRVDGEVFNGGSCTEKDYPGGYDLTIGSKSFIDGFEDALIGKEFGKTYDINVTFPEKYEKSEELAGKAAVFTVTINYKQGDKIKQKFNDEFVKKNLMEYKSAKEYKKKNRESIVRSMALKKVCEDTEINKYPEDKVTSMATQLKKTFEFYLAQQGGTLEQYLSSQNITEEEHDNQIKETAQTDVGNQLVYNAIAQAEKIEVTDEEYQTELQTYLTNQSVQTEDDLNKIFISNYGTTIQNIIYNNLLFNKISDFVYKNAKEV